MHVIAKGFTWRYASVSHILLDWKRRVYIFQLSQAAKYLACRYNDECYVSSQRMNRQTHTFKIVYTCIEDGGMHLMHFTNERNASQANAFMWCVTRSSVCRQAGCYTAKA